VKIFKLREGAQQASGQEQGDQAQKEGEDGNDQAPSTGFVAYFDRKVSWSIRIYGEQSNQPCIAVTI